MKIYTGFGDAGKTALLGGEVVLKSNARVHLYGTLDELNSVIGLLRSHVVNADVNGRLLQIQHQIFVLSAEIAAGNEQAQNKLSEHIEAGHIQDLENSIDAMSAQMPPLKNFILPGGTEAAAFSHLARTVCRRAERLLVELQQLQSLRPPLLIYLNRLSDYFFVLARFLNFLAGQPDVSWQGLKKHS